MPVRGIISDPDYNTVGGYLGIINGGEIPSLVMDQQISCLLVKLRVKSVSQQTKKVRCSKMVRMGQGNA